MASGLATTSGLARAPGQRGQSGLASLGEPETGCTGGYGQSCKDRRDSGGNCCCTSWFMPTREHCEGMAAELQSTCRTPEAFAQRKQEVMDQCCYWDDAYYAAQSATQTLGSAGDCAGMVDQMKSACGDEREQLRSQFNAQCCEYGDLQAEAEQIPSGDHFPCDYEGGSGDSGGSTGDVYLGDNLPCAEPELCIGDEEGSWLADLLKLLPLMPALLQMLFGDKGSEEFDLSEYSHGEAMQALALYSLMGLAGGALAYALVSSILAGEEEEEEEEK